MKPKKPDVLDYVSLYSEQAIKALGARGLALTPEIALKIIERAIESVRETDSGTVYLRATKSRHKRIFELWEQTKHGDMTMNEIYAYIGGQLDIPPLTVREYINRFRGGYDPTKPPTYEELAS